MASNILVIVQTEIEIYIAEEADRKLAITL